MQPFEVLLLFNLIATALTLVLMVLCKKLIRKEAVRDTVLKIASVSVVLIHYSSLYVDFFTNGGTASVDSTMILPVYPCNICMWLLLIVSFMKKRESRIFKALSEFTFIGGTLCGLIGAFFNINFLATPNLLDYDILKGLISHWLMIFGTVYLFVFGYVKLRVARTMVSIISGLVIFSISGLCVNVLFGIFDLPSVNAMFMLEPPFPAVPFLNYFTVGIAAVTLSFIGLNIYEFIALPKEERWMNKILNNRRK